MPPCCYAFHSPPRPCHPPPSLPCHQCYLICHEYLRGRCLLSYYGNDNRFALRWCQHFQNWSSRPNLSQMKSNDLQNSCILSKVAPNLFSSFSQIVKCKITFWLRSSFKTDNWKAIMDHLKWRPAGSKWCPSDVGALRLGFAGSLSNAFLLL